MTDREKLIELVKSGHSYYYSEQYNSMDVYEAIADHLIANGVTFREDAHWATEQAYKNGYEAGKKFATENNVAYKMKATDEIDFDYEAED